jgi:hypothetical protein
VWSKWGWGLDGKGAVASLRIGENGAKLCFQNGTANGGTKIP